MVSEAGCDKNDRSSPDENFFMNHKPINAHDMTMHCVIESSMSETISDSRISPVKRLNVEEEAEMLLQNL